ncbi:DEAD/DEAH box helicase family protein [bacterium]|nr:DEAD/DEAH box helicase family protein [bacterium]
MSNPSVNDSVSVAVDSLPSLSVDNIDSHFPKESYRKGQKEAIEFACEAFNSGKRIVMLEVPTGGGKSAIGMTVADMVKQSYYLTITKILQDQLVDDFGDQITELKGRNAYPCTFYDRYGESMVDRKLWTRNQLNKYKLMKPDCSNGFCKSKFNSGDKFKCDKCFLTSGVDNSGKPKGDLKTLPIAMSYSACPYYEQVHKATRASKVVMNFNSFLFQTQMTKRFDDPRDLMVIDECHNVEPILLDFVSFSLNDIHLMEHGVAIPPLATAHEYKKWMEDCNVFNILFNRAKLASSEGDSKLFDELSRVIKKYEMFIEHMKDPEAEWVCEYTKLDNCRKLEMKPVFAKRFAHNLLFKYAPRILMMSATILDVNVVCRSLGIDREHVAAYRVENSFPVENRPIKLVDSAKMTGGKGRMHEWGPNLVRDVNKIVTQHDGEKGIIHTHNFAIMDLILNKCNKDVRRRLLHQRDFRNKKDLLEAHAKTTDSVLIAPAMHEGIDLIGDLSRFQIICKIPYANCFDNEQLARRVEVDRKYYTWLTALKLIQSYGRSIRSEDDKAVTYVLDESIHKFLRDAGKMIPSWFKDAIC